MAASSLKSSGPIFFLLVILTVFWPPQVSSLNLQATANLYAASGL